MLANETIAPYLGRVFGLGENAADSTAVLLVVVPLTYLNVVVGELVPKSLALRSPRRIVLSGSRALFLADRALGPAISFLESSTNIILKLFFLRPREEKLAQTSVEIDSLSPTHQRFVLNMANIEERKVRDLLLPWQQVSHVTSRDTIDAVTQVVFNSGHTRLPVVDGDNIIGVLHTKEFMALRESGEKSWLPIVRPVLTVRAGDSSLGLLRLMQERRSHLSIVYSPTGERLGIVTLEDIVEEIIGDIFDEDDDGRIRKVFATRAKDRSIHPK
jgi:putative hemolysin